ncbi:MAG: radical SAM protein, partial [Paraclostridium sp.]
SGERVKKTASLLSNAFSEVNWTWHGGEPLTVDMKHYREFHNLISESGLKVSYQLQTNGTLLTKEIRADLKELSINASLSYDFTNKNVNRKHAVNIGKMDPFCDYSAINVVDLKSSYNLIDVYETTKNGKRNISFNKIFLSEEAESSIVEYVENWKKYFKHYLFDESCVKQDRFIMSYFNKIFGITNDGLLCDKENCLNKFISVNPEGDVFHCDRFGNANAQKYCFGNVDDYEFTMLEYKQSKGYEKMIEDILKFKEDCFDCEIVGLCEGICLANRVNNEGKLDLSYHSKTECYFEKEFFSYIFETVFNLGKEDLLYLNPIIFNSIFENKIVLKFMIKEIQRRGLDENVDFN